MGAFLSVNRVSFAYDKQMPVCEDITFGIESNGMACLLGPSGCGKTTVLRLIAGFEAVHRGEILIGGKLFPVASNHVP